MKREPMFAPLLLTSADRFWLWLFWLLIVAGGWLSNYLFGLDSKLSFMLWGISSGLFIAHAYVWAISFTRRRARRGRKLR